ncbi:tetratricopeptide repeat protein [Streptomyces sp. 900105755]
MAPARPVVTHSLRRDVPSFTGRDTELQHLLGAGRPGHIITIYTIDGMPGVGKTALATRAAHLLAGRFPDGQHFVDLRAHAPGGTPAEPADVLADLLTGFGIDPQALPPTLEGRSALWRDRLNGRAVLLVLDDAANHTQIEPLLPASPTCLTLITSRKRLIALDGAESIELDTLPPRRAAELFTRLAHRTPAAAEAEAITEAVALCGHLPLAVVLLAGRLMHHRRWTIEDFLADFFAARDRLGELSAESRAVATAFYLSYRDLPAERQRVFRLLSLHPGADLDSYAAAALTGMPRSQVRTHLEGLFTDHLLDEVALGRYRLHDLLREYARTLTTREDPVSQREEAVDRLHNYYLETAQTADRQLALTPRAQRPPTTPGPFDTPPLRSRSAALTWMREERANLLSCLDHATSHSRTAVVVGLTSALAAFMIQEGPWPQAAELHERAVQQALAAGDRAGEACSLHDLGVVRYRTGDYPTATTLLRRSLGLYEELEDHMGQANALSDLGTARRLIGDFPAAIDSYQRSLILYQDLDDQLGMANALNGLGDVARLTADYQNAADLYQRSVACFEGLGQHRAHAYALNWLGDVRLMTGDEGTAAALHQQSLALFKEFGDRLGQANALWSLGRERALTGDYPAAVTRYEEALDLFKELGNEQGQVYTLNVLGDVRLATGEYPAAEALFLHSLALCERLGNRHGHAAALQGLAEVQLATGHLAEATDLHQRALVRFRELGDRVGEANALWGLGQTKHHNGEYPQATDYYEQARLIWADLGDRQGESKVLSSLGALLAETSTPHSALKTYQKALQLARNASSPRDEARALAGAAHCWLLSQNSQAALDHQREAVAIYQRIGSAERDEAVAFLAALEGE